MSDVLMTPTTTPPQTAETGVAAYTTTAPGTGKTGLGAATTTAPQTGATGIGTASTAVPGTASNPLAHFAAPLPTTMPSIFQPAFVEIDTGGSALKSLTVSSADNNKVLQGTVAGELKNYQVRPGTDAESLPGIVHPANYDAATNAYVFVMC